MAQKSFVCIDIGSYHLKVALFTKQGKKLSLVKFLFEKINLPSGDAFKEAIPSVLTTLSSMLLKMNIEPKSNLFYLSLPGQLTFCRLLKLPLVDRSKIHQMVQYEAQQQVPFSLDEVTWDYEVLGNPDPEHLHVLLTALRKEWGHELLKYLRSRGIEVELIAASPLASYHCLSQIAPAKTDPIVLMNIGHKATNLIIYNSSTVWVRTIPIGGDDFTKEVQKETRPDSTPSDQSENSSASTEQKMMAALETASKRLSTELARSIGFYNTQFGSSKISAAYLTGGASQISSLEENLNRRLSVKISPLNPFEGLPIENLSGESPFLLSEIAGLALRADNIIPSQINLLPKSYLSERKLAKKKEYFFYSAITLLLILLVQILSYRQLASIKKTKLENIQKISQDIKIYSQEIKTAVDQTQNYSLQILEIERMTKERAFWVYFFQEIEKATPPNIWLTKFTTSYLQEPNRVLPERSKGSPPGIILFTFYCKTNGTYKDVSDFREKLEKLSLFQTVQIRSANPPINNIRDFVIQAEVKE